MSKTNGGLKRYLKRIAVGFATGAYILAAAVPNIAAAKEEPEYNPNARVLFKYTGDSADDSAFVNSFGDVTFVDSGDEEHKNAVRLKAENQTASVYVNVSPRMLLESGYAVMSWDYKTDNIASMSYVRAFTDFIPVMSESVNDKMFETLMYGTGSRMGFMQGLKGFTLNAETVTIPRDAWQHTDVWFDLNRRTAKLYVDGKLVSIEAMPEGFDKFCGFVFNVTPNGGAVTNMLDNICVGYVPSGGYKTGFDFTWATPDEVEQPFSITLRTNRVGNIYTGNAEKGNNIKIDADIKNPYDREQTLDYEFMAITSSGRTAYTENKTVSFKPFEVKDIPIEFSVSEYGFYNISLKVTNRETNKSLESTTRLSIVRSPTGGRYNEKIGLNSHYIVGKGLEKMEELQKLFADVGIRHAREGITWAHYESQNGVYGLFDSHIRMLKTFEDNKQINCLLLGHENLARKIQFPKTDEEIEAWKKYVEGVVKDVKSYGYKYFSVWNEVDYWQHLAEPKDYVRLMQVSYEIIHRYIPDAVVYSFDLGSQSSIDFEEKCFEYARQNGISFDALFDGVAIHPYTHLDRPEEGKFLKSIQNQRDLLEKFGIGYKRLTINEIGYTNAPNWITTEQQAQFCVRMSEIGRDKVDFITWYVNLEKIDAALDKEIYFGWLKGWRGQEINYEAKPVFAAMSNYNAFMAGSEPNGGQDIFDGGGRIHKYKQDGKDVYMIWKVRDSAELCLDIGADSAEIYDMYGTPREQKTKDGKLFLSVNESPQYVVGNFTACSEIKDEVKTEFSTDVESISSIHEDLAYINVRTNANDGEYRAELDIPESVTVENQTGFINGEDRIELRIGSKTETGNTIRVNIKDKDNNAVWYKEIPITVEKSADAELTIEYYKSLRWKGVLKVTNYRQSGSKTGVFKISSPTELTKYRSEIDLGDIPPNTTKIVEFPIPVTITNDYIDLQGEVVFDNGERVAINESSYFVGLTPIPDKSPKIDGVIESGEYNTTLPIRFNKARMVQVPTTKLKPWNWGGLNDLSAIGYINYDRDYFYLAYEVADDILGDYDEKGRIWACDSIQFAFANNRTADGKTTEIGIGLVDGKPKIQRYLYMGEDSNILYQESIGKKEGFNDDTELSIVRKGTKTTYELKLSWQDIYPTTAPFNADTVYFATIINENDRTDEGRLGWLEFSPGIGIEKRAELFTKIPVTGN